MASTISSFSSDNLWRLSVLNVLRISLLLFVSVFLCIIVCRLYSYIPREQDSVKASIARQDPSSPTYSHTRMALVSEPTFGIGCKKQANFLFRRSSNNFEESVKFAHLCVFNVCGFAHPSQLIIYYHSKRSISSIKFIT